MGIYSIRNILGFCETKKELNHSSENGCSEYTQLMDYVLSPAVFIHVNRRLSAWPWLISIHFDTLHTVMKILVAHMTQRSLRDSKLRTTFRHRRC